MTMKEERTNRSPNSADVRVRFPPHGHSGGSHCCREGLGRRHRVAPTYSVGANGRQLRVHGDVRRPGGWLSPNSWSPVEVTIR
jgi:hypothetical protein